LLVHIVLVPLSHPKEVPSTHFAFEICFESDTLHVAGGAGVGPGDPAEQFMIGVVTVRGDAEIAHIDISVWYSTAVMVPSLPLAWAACS
jgi:hypothetical protein